MSSFIAKFNPELDLRFERVVDVAPELVWAAWTKAEHIVHWFTPEPWKTIACEIDLRPGGIFSNVMQSPEGQQFPHSGCYLEVVENERLVWTGILGPSFRPQNPGEMPFTAVVSMKPEGEGTRYSAWVMHLDAEGRKKHEEMGFEFGWGKALEQLVAYMKTV